MATEPNETRRGAAPLATIALGYDASDESARALDRAAQLVEAFGARLVVLSVAPVVFYGPRSGGPVDPVDSPELHREQLEHARAILDARGVDAEYVEAVGEPGGTIVDLAHDRGADLIVVGTREPNFLQRLLGQSVSHAVARRARCDVLIVH